MFWHLTPKRLGAFFKAYNLKRKMKDEEMWILGIYIQSAVSTAIEHNLAGAKAKSKYIEKPFLHNDLVKGELTEEEKQKAVDLFFAKENARRVNWRRNHKKNSSVS